MSAKKGRRAKTQKTEMQTQKASDVADMDSPNLSAIERASFMEGLQKPFGNPLHSTAMEEDLNVPESQKEEEKAGRKPIPKTQKTFVKQRGDAAKRKNPERDAENEEEEEKKKKSRRSTGGNVKAGPEKEAETKKKKGAPLGQRQDLEADGKESDAGGSLKKKNPRTPAASSVERLVRKKPAKRRSSGQMPAARKEKQLQVNQDRKRETKSGRGKSDHPEPQEESDTETQRKVLPSDEEVVDDDTSWIPSPKNTQKNSLGQNRKSSSDRAKSGNSSSGSASEEPDKADTDQQRRKKQGRQRGTELEVVLDAFADFCDDYRESVKSKAVKQSIESFSTVVKQQLMEKISSQKELRVLKRENMKVGSLIRKKTQRLLDAKHEMMRMERQLFLQKKERSELKLRLLDLRRGQAFLQHLRQGSLKSLKSIKKL
ncbi:centromere protein U [Notolabrus celidotus]|uniref:centromere protein U n=1 Tax=Notolabrus celidotus TaxID=1203425 RepID=UPI00148FCD70|nr:centromere protein U [Notolabrus celidotus]